MKRNIRDRTRLETLQFGYPCATRRKHNLRAVVIAAFAYMIAGLLTPRAFGQFQYQQLKSFGFPEVSKGSSVQGMIEGSGGDLYGTTEFGGENDTGTLFRLNEDGSGYLVLHNFGTTDGDGLYPSSVVLEESDGALYGATAGGGSGDGGTIFKLNKDGSGYTILHSFTRSPGEGFGPGALIEGGSGVLYGRTANGGIDFTGGGSFGTLFKLNKDGTGYTVLHRFSKREGGEPNALVKGVDGKLYGTTREGGITNAAQPEGMGTVFRLNMDISDYTVLHQFTGYPNNPNDGLRPTSLLQGTDGVLYGTTENGGAFGEGTVFRINTDGGSFAVLRSFSSPGGGYSPQGALVEGSGGDLYGTTESGGNPDSGGTVFKLNKNGGDYSVLHNFTFTDGDGASPFALVQGREGALYGTTVTGTSDERGTVFKLNRDGSGFRMLLRLTGTGGDGDYPNGTLVEGNDHALYGTTLGGGSNDVGTAFKFNLDGGHYTVLHNFAGSEGTPSGGLVRGSDGTFYGTTRNGGSNHVGTVFKFSQDGSGYAVLLNFSSTNGEISPSPLVQGSDGALYGTTWGGGITCCPLPYSQEGMGTVFKLNTDGSGYRVLHEFRGMPADGANPGAGLVEASDGRLYGTTPGGGAEGAGALFTLNKDGGGYRILHDFSWTNQYSPHAALVEGSDGALYGTTAHGREAVFKVNKDGSGYLVLASLNGSDYLAPSGLIVGADGVFYGTTPGYVIHASENPPGTVFRLNQDGSGYGVLYSFPLTNGLVAPTGLVQGSDGSLYGTTSHGGDLGFGAIFALRPKPALLPPMVTRDGVIVRFTSMPGSTQRLQRAGTLGGNWLTLTNVVVPTNGVTEFTDPAPPQPSGFYRTVAP
jgi:uncharacterized repeat protein (TIGR03803 family)